MKCYETVKWYLNWQAYTIGEVLSDGFEVFETKEQALERIKELKQEHLACEMTYNLIEGNLIEEY